MWKWIAAAGSLLWLAGTLTAHIAMARGVRTESVRLRTADGTPVAGTLYRPSAAAGQLPAVVVVHGTGLTHRSCAPGLSVPLARNGYLVLAIDLRGHGHSASGLPRDELTASPGRSPVSADQPEVESALDFVRSHPRFTGRHLIVIDGEGGRHVRTIERLAVVGHSRGGWAAAQVGCRRPEVQSVVSIGAAPAMCDAKHPQNLLILTGGQEELCSFGRCLEAIGRATAGGLDRPSAAYGEFWNGSARRLLRVSGVTHLTELADPSVTRCVAQWVGSSLDIDAGPVRGARLNFVIAAVLVATAGGLTAGTGLALFLTRLLLGPPAPGSEPRPLRRLALCGALIMVSVPAAAWLGSRAEVGPAYTAVPVGILLTLTALACFLAGAPGARRLPGVQSCAGWRPPARGALFGLAFLVWTGFTIGLPWNATWADVVPDGRRLFLGFGLMVLVVPPCLVLAWAFYRVTGRESERRAPRMIQGAAWMAVPVALLAGYAILAAGRWPLFLIPAGWTAVSFVAPLPLWLVPHRPGMTVARGVCHAGALAWLLACHLPFVGSG
jgi:pimeloyl-ACP methyl ester carboxylesterase